MQIVKSTDTTHNLKLIPRVYTSFDIVLTLINEENKEIITPINTFTVTDGILTVVFDYNFTNKQRFSIKIEDIKDSLIYRGKLICLDDETQDVKQSKDYYIYG